MIPRAAALVVLPAAALGTAALCLPAGPAWAFQADVTALAVAAGAFGLVGCAWRAAIGAAFLAATPAALVHGAVTGLWAGAFPLGLLVCVTALCSSGLAALGRRVGTPSIAAGAVAACVLWTGMTGLSWADRVAEGLPATERRVFRQAVLHVDLATAAAYDAADFDRLHDPDVYERVPLATSMIERPRAVTTAAVWGAAGLLAWAAALLLGARRPPDAA